MYGESKLLRTCGDFLNMSHPFEPLRTRRSCSVSVTEAFDGVTLLAIRDTLYVRKPIRKCVRAVLGWSVVSLVAQELVHTLEYFAVSRIVISGFGSGQGRT